MSKNQIVLVGLGSIGSTHLKHISKLFSDIIIVDRDSGVAKKAEKILGSKNYLFLNSVSDIPFSKYLNHAVIANWGPDHFKTLHALHELGIKRYIIEKPITDSISDLIKLRKIRDKSNLQIFVNFQWGYSPLNQTLLSVQKKSNIGDLLTVNVTGGAKCIATNGIHYLDLANKLFKDNPIETMSNMYNSELNPRQDKFLFLGGAATWVYGKNRYLNISFSNESRISPKMELIFNYGFGIIEGDELSIYRIENESISKNKSPTKTFYPTEKIYSGRAFTFPDNSDGLDKIYSKFTERNIKEDNFDSSFKSNLDFFAALLSSNKASSVKLPVKISRFSSLYYKKWKIS